MPVMSEQAVKQHASWDILTLSFDEHIALPLRTMTIAELEQAGYIVDLQTGAIEREAPIRARVFDAKVTAWHAQGLKPVPTEDFGNLERWPWIKLVPIEETESAG